MKKIKKSTGQNLLNIFQSKHPHDSWEIFRELNSGSDYQTVRKIIFYDQGGLCGYCERKVSNLPRHRQRIEHFHSKSDTSNQAINWALDWQNVFGVCIGGGDADNKKHQLPANLSCDAYKEYLIRKGKLAIACEGYYLNPVDLIASPCLFHFDKATGNLTPNREACGTWEVQNNQYTTTYELVEKTIEILNLNCQRLLDDRLEVLKDYNQQVARMRRSKDMDGFSKLAQRWFRNAWPSFFTSRRILLGSHAEAYLNQIAYNG